MAMFTEHTHVLYHVIRGEVLKATRFPSFYCTTTVLLYYYCTTTLPPLLLPVLGIHLNYKRVVKQGLLYTELLVGNITAML